MRRERYKGYIAAGVTAFLVLAATLLLFFALFHIQVIRGMVDNLFQILRPVLYGLVLAFLLLPIHRHIKEFLCAILNENQRRNERILKLVHFIAIVLSLVVAVLIIYILLAMILPQVYLSLAGFVDSLPYYLRSLQDWIMVFLHNNPGIEATVLPYLESAALSVQEWFQKDILPNLESAGTILEWVKSTILPGLTSVAFNLSAFAMAFVGLLTDILIAVIVSVYLLVRKDKMAAQSKKIVYSIFPTHVGDFIVEETRNAYRILSGFINGKLVDSLIIGMICLVCCNLFDFPYPALIATVVGVTNIIPFFGPFIGAIPCSLLILLVNPVQCIYFVIFILALQQFDGNILGPKILGDSTGLDAFWVLFSILLFGGLFGFAGMVLGVPVFAMFYSIVNRLVRYGLRKKGLPQDTSKYIGKTKPLSDKRVDF